MTSTDPLLEVLERARELGFLGPGPSEAHLDHSAAFLRALEDPVGDQTAPSIRHALDLGSGGGVPGLVLAWHRPEIHWTLLDANTRRTGFLVDAVAVLGLQATVDVVTERAEVTGHGARRATQDLVVARSFAPPPVTAECAAPLLAIGGRLVVSEPPARATAGDPSTGVSDRWPAAPLRQLGLVPRQLVTAPVALQVLELVTSCPDRYPRRVGVPAKRPLF